MYTVVSCGNHSLVALHSGNGLFSINEVTLHRAWLVLRWQVNHLSM